jgi:uncharacterized cupredoxin-like copper-binding protein
MAIPTRHRPPHTTAGLVVGVIVALFALAGCGADRGDAIPGIDWDATSATTVNGYDTEYAVVSDHATIHAGEVTFDFENKGTINHEVVLIRTDYAPDQIPIASDGRMNEEDPRSLNVGETGEMVAGKAVTFSVKLTPGRYQLVCNIANHYLKGMYSEFIVS